MNKIFNPPDTKKEKSNYHIFHNTSKMKKNPIVNLEAQRRKRNIVSKIERIPPLPATAYEVFNIVAGDPDDIKQLEQIIMHDPSLSLQLLKVANSAAYCPITKITTIHRAIIYLGFSEVKNIVLSLSITSIFKDEKKANSNFDSQAFWEHSIGVAMISRIIAGEVGLENLDMYFTCGLLHDIGRLVIDICFPDIWQQILFNAQKQKISLLEAEKALGYPHNVIGAWLIKNWRLPDIYLRTIVSHHLPLRHPHFNFDAAIIKLADCLCHDIGLGVMEPPFCNKYKVANYIGLSKDRLMLLEEHLNKICGITEAITQDWL